MSQEKAPSGPQKNQPINLLDSSIPPHESNEQLALSLRETREKLNEAITRIAQLENRLQTTEVALYRTIQKFDAHSHNALGIAVAPVGS